MFLKLYRNIEFNLRILEGSYSTLYSTLILYQASHFPNPVPASTFNVKKLGLFGVKLMIKLRAFRGGCHYVLSDPAFEELYRFGATVFAPRRFGAQVLAPRSFGGKVLALIRFDTEKFWHQMFWHQTIWRRFTSSLKTEWLRIYNI